jgi:hypothetical protein
VDTIKIQNMSALTAQKIGCISYWKAVRDAADASAISTFLEEVHSYFMNLRESKLWDLDTGAMKYVRQIIKMYGDVRRSYADQRHSRGTNGKRPGPHLPRRDGIYKRPRHEKGRVLPSDSSIAGRKPKRQK